MKRSSLYSCFLGLVVGSLWACGGGDSGSQQGGEGGADSADGGSHSDATGGTKSTTKSSSSKGGENSGGKSDTGGTNTAPSSSVGGAATGGSSAAGGSSATGGSSAVGNAGTADKLDLLLMIDNSLSMGDKQVVLSMAVPQLLTRLANPYCVSADSAIASQVMNDPVTHCPNGLHREFAPLTDIHIGVVTSSLGDFGGDVCPESSVESTSGGFPDQNDHGWLLGALPRTKNASVVASEFLTWSAKDAASYGTAILDKTKELRSFVAASGEIGCGYEMTLESWYRFLVDPKPPVDVTNPNSSSVVRGDVDQNILAQRKRFLRSDSVVAVVMLTDENDCSFKDFGSYSWVPGTAANNFRMWRASNACATNPNDECCFSCMMVGMDNSIPQRCLDADPTCQQDSASKLTLEADPIGLRCMNVKQRYGFDFLFPVTRYSNALTKPVICPDQTYGDLDCECTAAKAKGVACEAGTAVTNPLYDNLDPTVVPTGPDRKDAKGVLFAGIVGVPWQDLATDAALAVGSELEYKPARQLNWALFAPKDDVTLPTDPFMIESITPRSGANPVTGDLLQPPTSARNANRINGHEWNTGGYDLQFACTFNLEQPIVDANVDATRSCIQTEYCASATDSVKCARQFAGCACKNASDPAAYTENSPVCQKADRTYSTTQTQGKAYPAIRQLRALRAFHEQTNQSDNAIVASICPKDMTFTNQQGRGYGYNPAVSLLVKQLTPLLK
jgi:hypothetical protein